MLFKAFSSRLKLGWQLIAIVGLFSFAVSFGALNVFATDWVATAVPIVSQTALAAVLAAVVAQFAMSLTSALLTRQQSREIAQMRTAIDSMAQGLCMFDAAERLIVCNAQYYEMYGLTAADARPGSTLSEVLAKRVAKGTSSRDPHQYRKEFLAAVRDGRTIVHEVKSAGGRLLLVTNHPMKSGGWIGTHEDITERRQAEQQHIVMQQQEERRAAVEDAILTFRNRVENLLQVVAERAGEMHLTATSLFDAAPIATALLVADTTGVSISGLTVDGANNGISGCAPDLPVVVGDARLTLAASTEKYNLIILDAFSSDTIPVHLLTREAVADYLKHLAEGGVILMHISNRYTELADTVAAVGTAEGLAAIVVKVDDRPQASPIR